MPNPLLSVRIPPDLNSLLPHERGERSRITIEALRTYLLSIEQGNEITQLEKRIEAIEHKLGM